jgi:hypothetical protein
MDAAGVDVKELVHNEILVAMLSSSWYQESDQGVHVVQFKDIPFLQDEINAVGADELRKQMEANKIKLVLFGDGGNGAKTTFIRSIYYKKFFEA